MANVITALTVEMPCAAGATRRPRVPALQLHVGFVANQPERLTGCAATVTIFNVAQGALSSVARRMSKEGKTELLPIDSFLFAQAKGDGRNDS